MSNSVASGDASSVSASVTSVASSPRPGAPMPAAVEYSNMPLPAVEPQNPFDNVILETSRSGSSQISSGTSALMQTPARGNATPLNSEHNAALINAPGPVVLSAAATPPLLTPPRTALIQAQPGNLNNNTPPVQQTPPPLRSGSGPHRPFLATVTSTPTAPQQQQQRQVTPQQQPSHNMVVPPQHPPATTYFPSDTSTATDDNTAPSSAANTTERGMMHHDDDHDEHGTILRHNNNNNNNGLQGRSRSVTRFIDNTRRRLSRKDGDSDDDEGGGPQGGSLIAGYLQKLGRNGKWQTRWFETDGECLSYYKSAKRSKLLATLDLQKVGLIEIDMDDAKECSFRIQVLGRLYHLRASTRGQCRDWVITLNRVKEARMQQGNVKLVGSSRNITDLLDQNASNTTPRVVVVSNRQRTRAVDAEEQWDEMIGVNEMNTDDPYDPAYINLKRHSALSSAVVARWSKRRSSLQRLGTKLSQWARSLKKYSCQELERENVILDQHVHPPGHDDNKSKAKGHPVGWIEKEASNATMSSHVTSEHVGHTTMPVMPSQLTTKDRSLSTASSDYRVIS